MYYNGPLSVLLEDDKCITRGRLAHYQGRGLVYYYGAPSVLIEVT